MNNRLESLQLAAVAALKQGAGLPCGSIDLVARRMIIEVPGKPPSNLGRD